jgi:hypothetical protein
MTLSDIYTQQVLNNLAMFTDNPYAVPFFAFPNQGTTAIQDSAIVGNPGYSGLHFVTSPFVLNASRQATENWVLVPVSDAGKLALMRCAYQQAIAPCIGADLASASVCPNCLQIRNDFHNPANDHPNQQAGGLLCLNSATCWLGVGNKSDVPPKCKAPYVGCYGERYVWVLPDGRDMMARLTLTILDYAGNDPVQYGNRTKTVEMTVNENGDLATDKEAGVKITAVIPIDQPSSAVKLFESPALQLYAQRFTRSDADEIIRRAAEYERRRGTRPDMIDELMQSDEYWQQNWDAVLNPRDQKLSAVFVRQPEYSGLSQRAKEALYLILRHLEDGLTPSSIPPDSVLRAPIVREKKGAASQGLQNLGQRINAALGRP